jgi:hypothetical protein
MDALGEASAVLRDAEQQLRLILVRAAENGNYDLVPRIAEWAKLLNSALGGQPVIQPLPAGAACALPSDNGVHEPEDADEDDGEDEDTAPAPTRKARGRRRAKGRRGKATKEGYPKFVREGDSLVKIGWSKSEDKTYEHKAPRAVLRALIQTLARVGAGGERFTVEPLLPLRDTASGREIPDYQTYLTLAWLRNANLVTQHGRQGYSLPEASILEREAERQWVELKTR